MARLAVLALGSAFLVVSLGAQSPRPPQSAQGPIFRTGVDHVAVDVVVTDKDDKPITDLTKDDFQIVERDHSQTIADFKFISVPPGSRPVDLKAEQAAPADIASNGQSPETSRAVAFAFDMSLKEADIIPWKRELTQFLEKMSPDDQMAVVYGSRSDLGQDFTNDAGKLVRAINNLPAAMGIRGGSPLRSTIETLDNVVKTLAAAHQARRYIVLASAWGCVPTGKNIVNFICRDMIARAKREDVPIYAIAPPNPNLFLPPPSMRVLAEQTGGRAFMLSEKVGIVSNDILVENGSYYLLGFYPDPLVRDGAFHDITVTVKRPGAHVRAREGFAAPPEAPLVLTPRNAMDSSLAAGLDDPSLSLRASVAPIAVTPRGMRAVVTIEVTYPTPADGSRIDDDMQLGILALDPDAHVRAQSQRPLRFAATTPPKGSASFLIDDVIDLPAQQLALRVGVSSKALGTTGTIHLALKVPNPTDDELQLSSVVLGFADGRRAAAMNADLISAIVPFQPTATRTFTATDRLRVYARAFWGSKDAAAAVTLTILGNNVTTPTTLSVEGVAGKNGHREGVIDETIALAALTPGPYTLRIDATLPNKQTSRRDVPFEIK